MQQFLSIGTFGSCVKDSWAILWHSSFLGVFGLFPYKRSFTSMTNLMFVQWDSIWKFEMICVLSSCFSLTKPGRMSHWYLQELLKLRAFWLILTTDEKTQKLEKGGGCSFSLSLSPPHLYPSLPTQNNEILVPSYFLYISNKAKMYLIYPFWQTYFFPLGLRCGRLGIRCVELNSGFRWFMDFQCWQVINR